MQCLVQLDVRICVHRGIGHGIRAVVDLRRAVLYNLEDERSLCDVCLSLGCVGRRSEVKVADVIVVFIISGKSQLARERDLLVVFGVLIRHHRLEIRRGCDFDSTAGIGII